MNYHTVDNLKAVRELLSDPSRWTKGCFARDSKGVGTSEYFSAAKSFCLAGACYRVGGNPALACDVLRKVIGRSVPDFNDDLNTAHADVLAALDRAIEEASK